MKTLLIDGDIIAYRCACAVDNNEDATEAMVRFTIDSLMSQVIAVASSVSPWEDYDYKVYLTGSKVFREDIAVTAPYKGNRDKPKPTFHKESRDQLSQRWDAILEEPYEADDLIAMAASEDLENSIIVSLDKDFFQLPCHLYNFVTNEHVWVEPVDALRSLYKQCLTGDAIDNIIGAEQCGDVTASMLIDNLTEELDMALVCIDQMGLTRFLENMNLVYLLRSNDDTYVPPSGIFDSEYYCVIT